MKTLQNPRTPHLLVTRKLVTRCDSLERQDSVTLELVGLLVDVRSSQALDEVANCVSGV